MRSLLSSVCFCLALFMSAGSVHAADRTVLRHEGRLDAAAANWISMGHRVAAFGADENLVVAETVPLFRIRERYTHPYKIIEGVIAGTELYVVRAHGAGQRLAVLDLENPVVEPRPIILHPEPRGALHVAVMDDYLVVAEDGYGLRLLALPSHHHDHTSLHHTVSGPEQIGFLPLVAPVESITAVRRTIVVSTPDYLLVVNVSIPALPVESGRFPADVVVHSMAGNGNGALLLHAEGLSRLDIESGAIDLIDSSRLGHGIYQAGRDIYLAGDDGLQSFRDVAPLAATFVVQVGDVFFTPAGTINVNVGDTVEWQKPNTVFSHNVFSCAVGQAGCSNASTEAFVSGLPTTAAFNFQHTFQTAGANPYVCQVHNLSMRGDISVSGGAVTPPGVADGSGLSIPMTVDRAIPTGADLTVAFDTGCPDAMDHNILVGTSAELPASPGGTYKPTTARCDIGTSSPFIWATSPSPPAGDFVWWVLVADDGSGTEGAWGKDSSGGDRNGAGLGGASGLCAITEKDITNTCGQ